jgi:3-oxoacyl-(acyl-carrier-protein) synthase
MVNPWQATAWFPTAAQGFVSIRFGLRGFSKSFACDRASDACAVFFALRAIRWGYNDVVLTGGSEAPITRLGVAAHVSTGELSRRLDPEHAYLPFDRDRNGLVLGEGSTVLILEELAHAKQRGARIYGEVLAVEQRTGDPEDPSALESALTSALRSAACVPEQIDLVLADGCGTVVGDRTEALALHRVFGLGRARPRVTVPKAAYGHLYGASFSTELACGLLAMDRGVLPPTVSTRSVSPDCDVRLVVEAIPAHLEHVCVNGRSREGTNVCLVAARDIDG